jgi:hypothetical protein
VPGSVDHYTEGLESENRDFIIFSELEEIRQAKLLEKRPAIP